jgi:hypothetical protein
VASRRLLLTGAVAVAGANAVISLRRRVYDVRSLRGAGALAIDSSWNLLGSTAALAVHAVNALLPNAAYNDELSRGATYHVYDGGVTMRPGFAFTFGNVVTNAGGRVELVTRHEALHVWQQRALGPAFPFLYGAWMVGGAVVGALVWLGHRDQPLFSLVETAAYYDNPFEFWAYRHEGRWPPNRAHPLLAWDVGPPIR